MKLLLATADGVELLATVGGVELLAGEQADTPFVGVIAGDDVALHHVQLVETQAKKRLAEARMRATDLSAQPLDTLHLALSEPDAEGWSWLAVIDRSRMAGHLAHFGRHGGEPDHLVPAALLLPRPEGAEPSSASLGGLTLLRGADFAGAIDPPLAEAFHAHAGPAPFAAVASFPLPLDLRQGAFAPLTRWWKQRSFQGAAAALIILVAALAAAPLLVEKIRSAGGVAAADRATVAFATQALGKPAASAETAATALAAARKAAEGLAIGPRLSFLASTIEAVPNARLDSLRLQPDGRMSVTLGGPAGPLTAAGNRLTAGPFEASLDGRTLILGDRRAARATSDSALPVAIARAINAQADTFLVRATPRPAKPIDAAGIATAFTAAGLEPPSSGRIEAARATVLLPLIAQLEAKGARFTRLTLTRNEDQTLAAELGFAP